MDTNIKKMQILIEKLSHASFQYYVMDSPIMADAQWDKLYDELKKLEEVSGTILENSPSLQVGGKAKKEFIQHTHINRLYSMDKVQSLSELQQWIVKANNIYKKESERKLPPLQYVVEYKLDGLTLNLSYNEQKLIQAATRGDGYVGEAILQQAKTVQKLPYEIQYNGFIEVQGECIMKLSTLEDYNKFAEEPLKNARNAAAGALRNIDPKVTASRKLNAYFYSIGNTANTGLKNQMQLFEFLQVNGFEVSPYYKLCSSYEEIEAEINKINTIRNTLDFLIDGVVIKVNDFETRNLFGYTEKFPKWAVAYKFEAEEATTILKNVTWEVGRTGKLTPLAHLKNVDIGGVCVSKATLNNFGDIQRKKLSIGCKVWIRRSNDVIPEILGRVDEKGLIEQPITAPNFCPACNRPLIIDGAHLYCNGGLDCRPQAIAKFTHFVSKEAMDIEGLSTKTIEQLYDNHLVHNIDDIYTLQLNILLTLDKFQLKKANNLLNQIEKSKQCTLDRFIYALGISNVGRKTAKDLSAQYGTLENIMNAKIDDLKQIKDIGEIVAKDVIDYFKDTANIETINRLLTLGIQIQNNTIASTTIFQNQSIVITGTLPNLSRNDAKKLIEENGGKVTGSVSKNTSFVLLGAEPGSKYTKALELNIPMKNEEEFLAMINN